MKIDFTAVKEVCSDIFPAVKKVCNDIYFIAVKERVRDDHYILQWKRGMQWKKNYCNKTEEYIANLLLQLKEKYTVLGLASSEREACMDL